MAECSVQSLLSEASCYNCLTARQLELIQTALLCQILQAADPMASCDVTTLLSEAKCYNCLTNRQLQLIQTSLLCDIFDAGGGGGGGGQEVYSGNGDPNGNVTPIITSNPAVYYNLDVPGEMWWWSVAGQVWF